MRNFFVALTVLSICGITVFFLSKEKNKIQVVEKSNSVEIPPLEFKQDPVAKPKTSVRIPATKVKVTDSDALSEFPRTEINLFEKPLLLVEGVYAAFDEMAMITPIKKMNGFFYYDHQIDNGLEVVYDPETKSYGIFTGEIEATGNLKSVITFVEGKSFEIVYKNELLQKIIFKVDNTRDLKEIEYLKSIGGVDLIPDIKFSKIVPQ